LTLGGGFGRRFVNGRQTVAKNAQLLSRIWQNPECRYQNP